jgi:hypothetical protein
MGNWQPGWVPATVGEAREYLDAHVRDGDPDIVRACEAKVDVIEHHAGAGPDGSRASEPSSFSKPSLDELEEEGAD